MKTFGRIKHGTCPCCNYPKDNRRQKKAAKKSERQQARLSAQRAAKE